MNLYLHHALDRPWRQRCPDVPLIRVADDVLLLCRTAPEAKAAHATLTTLLSPAGMPVKLGFEQAVRRLTPEEPADWLGFRITRQKDDLVVGVSDKAWEGLAARVARAHEEPDSPLRASAVITGWVGQMGPCYPHVDHGEAYGRIAAIAHDQAFEEIPGRQEIRALWQRAYARWVKLAVKAAKRTATT